MSKKKPTAPIPLTGVVTITTDGRTTLAMKASHRGEDIEVSTGLSHCRPGDVYCEYEGARIALARLYGLDPFPKVENGSGEKGRWEKATKENCKVGSRVRVANAWVALGNYDDGDVGVVDSFFRPHMVYIRFDGKEKVTTPACFLDELVVWIPGAEPPADGKTMEQSEKKPFTPSFRVGDIVRLTEAGNVFHRSCQGKVGKVIRASETPGLSGARYSLAVNLKPGEVRHQYCTEWPDDPAPPELLYRDPEKGGEKA